MVERVVEFRAEGQNRLLAKAADPNGLADREIGVELAGAGQDALPCRSVAGGSVRADGRRSADGFRADPMIQAIVRATGRDSRRNRLRGTS